MRVHSPEISAESQCRLSEKARREGGFRHARRGTDCSTTHKRTPEPFGKQRSAWGGPTVPWPFSPLLRVHCVGTMLRGLQRGTPMRIRYPLIALLLFVLFTPSIGLAKKKSGASDGTVHVKGYYKKDGTYVRPMIAMHRVAGTRPSLTRPSLTAMIPTPTRPTILTRRRLASQNRCPTRFRWTLNSPPSRKAKEGKVVAVTNGDSLTLQVDKTTYKIRLHGIDAPEKDQPFGKQSTKTLSARVLGKTVKVLSQGRGHDGRTLGIVYSDGCVNTAMVKGGWAWYCKEVDSKNLATAEEEARAAKAGLWADPHPIAPWDWRHTKATKVEADATDPPPDKTPEAKGQAKEQQTEKKYWLTAKSGKRHNESCRYYKSSKGHPCGPNDGTPCKICGG